MARQIGGTPRQCGHEPHLLNAWRPGVERCKGPFQYARWPDQPQLSNAALCPAACCGWSVPTGLNWAPAKRNTRASQASWCGSGREGRRFRQFDCPVPTAEGCRNRQSPRSFRATRARSGRSAVPVVRPPAVAVAGLSSWGQTNPLPFRRSGSAVAAAGMINQRSQY